MPRACDDALSCTNDFCNESLDRCDFMPQMDFCAVDGTCYPNGTPNPDNECETCNAGVDGTAWSPRTGVTCTDSTFCTEPDACDASGSCAGPARTCDDGRLHHRRPTSPPAVTTLLQARA
jgi:hypothetical protein